MGHPAFEPTPAPLGADVFYEWSPTALCVHSSSPPLSSSLILFTLAGNINNSRSLRRQVRFLRWLWSYSTIEKPKDKSAKGMFTRKQGVCAKKPRREGKGHGRAEPRVRALALGPYGRAGADVLRTKYGTRRGREGEREKEADNKQGRRTAG